MDSPSVPVTVSVARIDLRSAAMLTDAQLAAVADGLDPDERARALRFRFDADRARFLVAHAGLRRNLGRLLGCAPQAVHFRLGEFGKPRLATHEHEDDDGQMPGSLAAPASPIFFNMSHSQEVALVAWTSVEVGVDVEDIGRDIDETAVGLTVFSPREQKTLATFPTGPPRRAAFYALWTRKEAILKALGTGLSREAVEIDLGFAGNEERGPQLWIDPQTSARFTVTDIDVGPAQKAAVAVLGDLAAVEINALTL